MALSRWRWVWIPALTAVLLAVVLLPGSRSPGSLFWIIQRQTDDWRNVTFRDDVQNALRVQRARLRTARLSDSLTAAARGPRAVRTSDGSVTVVYDAAIRADTARLWLEAAQAELARYPSGTSGGAPLIVALNGTAPRPGSRDFEYGQWMARRILPTPGRPACIAGVNLARWAGPGVVRHKSQRPSGPFLGLCALYRRFGSPGEAVGAWLGRGDWDYWRDDAGWVGQIPDARLNVPRREIRRPGLVAPSEWGYWYSGTPWMQIGCLRGTRSLCTRFAMTGGPDYWWMFSDFRRSQLIAYLIASGTQGQFAAFWRSPLRVADALQQAYGRPAGQIAYEAYTHWYYAVPGGPRAGPRLVLAGMLWAGAALVLAVVAGRRWKTEI